jgi:hypothetical protein
VTCRGFLFFHGKHFRPHSIFVASFIAKCPERREPEKKVVLACCQIVAATGDMMDFFCPKDVLIQSILHIDNIDNLYWTFFVAGGYVTC